MKHKTTLAKIKKLLKENNKEALTEEVRASFFMQLLGYTRDLDEVTTYTDAEGNPSNRLKCYKESRKVTKYIPPNFGGIQKYLDRIDSIEEIKDLEDDVPDEHEY